MEKTIVISYENKETLVAVLENKVLEGLYLEREKERGVVGNIYKGRVESIRPGIEAAFIDIGLSRSGFLHRSDLLAGADEETFQKILQGEKVGSFRKRKWSTSLGKELKANDEILVQAIKESYRQKGVRLSTYISIPGRFLVLMPGLEGIGVSRKIGDAKERKRLKDIIENIIPKNFGFIVRTEGENKTPRDFKGDVKYLLHVWKKIQRNFKRAPSFNLLHQELDLASKAVRDLLVEDVDKLIVNSSSEYRRLKKSINILAPRFKSRLELYRGRKPLLTAYNLDKEIDKIFETKIWLKSGGYITIEHTEGLIAIDVNSGRFTGRKNLEDTALKINLEAAGEIARQLRLRDIGGIIVIDFIDMSFSKNRQKVYQGLKDCLKKDRAKTKVLNISQFGIVEMTRQRIRESLCEVVEEPCPYCRGKGRIKTVISTGILALRKLKEYAASTKEKNIHIEVHPQVAKHLNTEKQEQLREISRWFRKKILVQGNEELHREVINFIPAS
ncbi:MAG: Rne/Rng family ribonuclease [Candidatus Ratteibacteria bacterium]|nr:Rne/Rng family ribonuclease [Candidatus Ratteibacteria bacterium]